MELIRGRLVDEDMQAACQEIARYAPLDLVEHYERALDEHPRPVRGWWRRLTVLAAAREKQERRDVRRANR